MSPQIKAAGVVFMFESLNEYIRVIYQFNKAQYALLVVALMSAVGVSVGLFAELVLRLLKIKGEP
ncbi:MFS transporter [Desulforamulus hydrothermalis]|nr:MFS transporter [Desulforamulus hydrothermalis]